MATARVIGGWHKIRASGKEPVLWCLGKRYPVVLTECHANGG